MSVLSFGEDATSTAEWKSFDGAQFSCSKWVVKNRKIPRAVIIGVHGISGAASDFNNLGSALSPKGISVYAYELRGQGNDPDPKRIGDLKDVQLWFSDLNSFISSVRKEVGTVPIFLYGESIGSLIVMHGFSAISIGFWNRKIEIYSLDTNKQIGRIHSAGRTSITALKYTLIENQPFIICGHSNGQVGWYGAKCGTLAASTEPTRYPVQSFVPFKNQVLTISKGITQAWDNFGTFKVSVY